jgi:hypothetical protein
MWRNSATTRRPAVGRFSRLSLEPRVSSAGLGFREFSDYCQRMERARIDVVRKFNRAVTQRVGALDDEYLSRDRSLGLSRLLWEVGPDGSEVRVLRSRLGLDSG